MAESAHLSGTLPWTKSCFVCGEANPRGLRLRSRVENGRVVLRYTPDDTDLGWRHLVHGGLAATLVDEVMTWAAILAAGGGCVAAEFGVRLRRPIRSGQAIRAEGWVSENRRGRLILTAGQIVDENGEALITATGKYVPMPADQLRLASDDFVNSPDSIPLEKLFPQAAKP